jgi:predicted kinase
MRGIPGSGKTTYIEEHFPKAVVCSSDHYFTDKDGYYEFNIAEIGNAHQQSMDKFDRALKKGKPLIVVDNTNIQWRYMEHYVEMAEEHGYDIRFIRLVVPVYVAYQRNIHYVSREIIERFANMLEELPGNYIKKETIIKEDGGCEEDDDD